MSNSNYNNPREENYKSRNNNDRSNFRDRNGGRRDGGGFRIRLSDNEMKAVKSIQETFQLRSTVAVLGFSVRTLSEMIKDEKLIQTITQYAKNNKNSSSPNKDLASEKKSKFPAANPFARPVKKTPIEETKQNINKEAEEGDDK